MPWLHRQRWQRWALRAAGATCCAVALAASAGAQALAQPAYRFRAQPSAAAPVISPQVLTAEERAFLAQLPEVRVAVPQPPARPYEQIGADGVISGIHPDMLVALARAFGFRVRPVVLGSWSEVLAAARAREVDLVMTLGVTAERLQHLEFTLGVTPFPGALFARVGAAPVALERARFALEREFLVNDFVRRQYPDAPVLTVQTTADALRAVAEGRADYYLGSLLEAAEWLASEPVAGVQAVRLLNYGTGYYHFGVRKDWAPLAAILNKGIQTLRQHAPPILDQALAPFEPAQRPPRPLALPDAEGAALVRHPVWRVGAVRGLTMLNDVDELQRHSGIAAEYTEQVARRLGVAVQVVGFDSVAAMLQALRGGAIDLVPFLTRTAAREREFRFSKPYLEMPYMLVARSDAPLYWGLEGLRGRRLALAREHPLREVLARSFPDITIVEAANGGAAMDLVAAGQADAAVEVKLFANLRVNSDGAQRLRLLGPVEELPAQFHFATLAAGAEVLPLVNRALADINDAERLRMLRRWVAVDLQPPFPWRRHLPVIGVTLAAVLAGFWLTLRWNRRLAAEVKQRRRSEQLLRDIATTVPGVAFRYVMGEDGSLRHLYVTPGAKAFLGIELEAGRTVLANLAPYLREDHRQRALAEEAASAASGERFKSTGLFQPPGCAPRWLHSEAVSSRDARGRTVWTGYVVDVSSERELQERLAGEAKARNLLLAAASHELRAPTHNLSLALQSIDVHALPAAAGRSLGIARNAAQTLTQLLNDVLDAARFDAGPLRLRPVPFVLRDLLAELAEAWGAVARDRGLGFHLEVAEDVPALVQCDPLRLRQVLVNLLSNACKYTHRGQVRLEVRNAPFVPPGAGAAGAWAEEGVEGEGPERPEGHEEAAHAPALPGAPGVLFEVRDTGAGLSAAQLANLFRPFVTLHDGGAADPAEAADQAEATAGAAGAHAAAAAAVATGAVGGSTGLGLVVSRKIARAMGGHLGVRSEAGRGSVFGAWLPLVAVAHPMSATPRAAPPAATRAKGTAVVVCDDDPVSRLLAAQMLRLRGFEVIEVEGGEAALAACQREQVGALLTDLDMPGMGGRDLVARLREAEVGQAERTVVVVCSGSPISEQGDFPGGVPPAYDAYLLKPLAMDSLLQVLRSHGVKPTSGQPMLAN